MLVGGVVVVVIVVVAAAVAVVAVVAIVAVVAVDDHKAGVSPFCSTVLAEMK